MTKTKTKTEGRLTLPRIVADLMAGPPITARPTDPLTVAAAAMTDHGVGSVIVVDGGAVVGILTERDLVGAVAVAGEQTVGDRMTVDPGCVTPDTDVADAWRQLATAGYRHLPVVDNGRLVGVVSQRDLFHVAQLRPVGETHTDVPRGLKGVVVAETALGDVRGLEGFYHYRQYSAVELAEKRSLEDVWHLLFEGVLPTPAERAAFAAESAPFQRLPERLVGLLPAVADPANPLGALRSALSILSVERGFRPSLDCTPAELRADAVATSAAVPAVIAGLWRAANSLGPLDPLDDLGVAANYLYLLTGERPDPAVARAIEQYLILTIDHGFNASTFTGRVVASTGADLGAAVVAALGSLSGPLHGGAPSRALDTLDAIGTADRAEPWIRDAVERGERIMGFGHPVYKTADPRSTMLREVARSLAADGRQPELFALAELVEATILRTLAELKPGRELHTNVEFYAGVVMEQCGLDRRLFTPTFAASRVIGWCAQIMEQATDNRIIRPSSRYVGPPPPHPVPAA